MSNLDNKIMVTKQGLEDLKKEYQELVEKRRPKAVDRVEQARELGDLSENSEYAAAKEDLAFIDGRIIELEEIIKDAKVIKIIKKDKKTVGIGSTVEVHVNNKKEVFTIVGEWEADPSQKRISNTSPLGRALLGKKIGEMITVNAPAGHIHYKILKIDFK